MAETILLTAVLISLLSIALILIRFIKGPSILDRVVAFDTAGIIAISLIVLLAHMADRFIYVDVALVYGLLSFIGVLVVARYHERGL
ncbi:MAG: monovalent cation/H+ antiporter complex subunit F [Spirochaetales bacterium]|nr:monovalent cation/H+ antiporter complex subunit F [Spirochaetales bacterium]